MRIPGYYAAALSAMLVSSVTAAAEAPSGSISTAGEAVVYVRPDEVVLNFGVEIHNVDLERAVAINDEQSARLVKALKAAGIADKHIQTEHMDVTIQYGHKQIDIDGYITRRSYSVSLKEVDKFESLIQIGLKSGANRLLGFDYRTAELRKHRDQARSMAIKAAKEKATALAAELDCKLGAPRSIGEGGSYYGYTHGMWGWQGGNAMSQNSMQAAPAGGGNEGETMSLGQIAVRATVSVTFDLLPLAAQ
jgi:uncharacterized protein YggE